MQRVKLGNRRGAEATTRLNRIIKEASRMFVERGYQRTSLNAILARSGGSKATLLKYFDNKAGLLAAVLGDVALHSVADAERVSDYSDPEQALLAFAGATLEFYVRGDSLVVYRSVIAEGYRHAQLAQGFYYGAYAKFVTALATRLENWHALGLVQCPDPAGDAERFLGMLRSGPHERALLGLAKTVTPKEINAHVVGTVRVFLRGIWRAKGIMEVQAAAATCS